MLARDGFDCGPLGLQPTTALPLAHGAEPEIGGERGGLLGHGRRSLHSEMDVSQCKDAAGLVKAISDFGGQRANHARAIEALTRLDLAATLASWLWLVSSICPCRGNPRRSLEK